MGWIHDVEGVSTAWLRVRHFSIARRSIYFRVVVVFAPFGWRRRHDCSSRQIFRFVFHRASILIVAVHLTHLTCTLCGKDHDATVPQNVSACCGKPLFAEYDLVAAARTL